MIRSIFDPANPNVERSGDMFTSGEGQFKSSMPTDVVDGVANAGERAAGSVGFDGHGDPVASDEAVPAEQNTADGDTASLLDAPADQPVE